MGTWAIPSGRDRPILPSWVASHIIKFVLEWIAYQVWFATLSQWIKNYSRALALSIPRMSGLGYNKTPVKAYLYTARPRTQTRPRTRKRPRTRTGTGTRPRTRTRRSHWIAYKQFVWIRLQERRLRTRPGIGSCGKSQHCLLSDGRTNYLLWTNQFFCFRETRPRFHAVCVRKYTLTKAIHVDMTLL